MVRRIAFIQTVAMLVERFRPRFQCELPAADCFHMLDESVRQDLIRHRHPLRAMCAVNGPSGHAVPIPRDGTLEARRTAR